MQQKQLQVGVSHQWPFHVVLVAGPVAFELQPEQAFALAQQLLGCVMQSLSTRLQSLARGAKPGVDHPQPGDNGGTPS
jgi:hypothetical protein